MVCIYGPSCLNISHTEPESGNSTLAGATAAVMANVVLVAYIIVAMKEDQSEEIAAEEKARKGE